MDADKRLLKVAEVKGEKVTKIQKLRSENLKLLNLQARDFPRESINPPHS